MPATVTSQFIEVFLDQGEAIYHVAPASANASITANGLSAELGATPWPNNNHQNGNYFWGNWSDAEEYVHLIGAIDQRFQIWQVKASDGLNLYHDPDGFNEESPSYFSLTNIASDKIKLVDEVICLDWEDRYH